MTGGAFEVLHMAVYKCKYVCIYLLSTKYEFIYLCKPKRRFYQLC